MFYCFDQYSSQQNVSLFHYRISHCCCKVLHGKLIEMNRLDVLVIHFMIEIHFNK